MKAISLRKSETKAGERQYFWRVAKNIASIAGRGFQLCRNLCASHNVIYSLKKYREGVLLLKKELCVFALAVSLSAVCSAESNDTAADSAESNDMAVQIVNSVGSNVSSDGRLDAGSAVNSLTNSVISNGINNYLHGENAKDWMKRTELQFYFRDNWKPVYSLETIQPLYENDLSTVFTQFRLANTSDIGTTANLGFGYRRTNRAETNMYGINVFYDHGFKEGHARIGTGLEYFSGYHELHANAYHAVSGEKEIDRVNHIFEKALSGYDVEYGVTLPKAQWAKFYVQGFVWDYKHDDDAKGYRLATELQLTPNISAELGYVKESGASGEKYVKFMYNLAGRDTSLFGHRKKNKPLKLVMRDKRLQKVRRENDIRVERYQKNADGTISKGLNVRIRAIS